MTCRNSSALSTRFPHLSISSTCPADLSISSSAFDAFEKLVDPIDTNRPNLAVELPRIWRRWAMARDAFSAHGAAHPSPGQRPGSGAPYRPALKGRPIGCLASPGRGVFGYSTSGVKPWAGTVGLYCAGHAQFAESAKLEQATNANMRGLDNGG